ncbi:hypothetical protein ACEN2I_11050 [Flavobacterium sp. W22_SRS_FK3]|uniref:hypothetical protein n=1 Tax=Flavobacterium sp. W22_SRS_FK3 TaxID=3240275 RepID=UPI003F93A2A4
MKYFLLVCILSFIDFKDQETDKLKGIYYFTCESDYFMNQKDKVVFKDSTYTFSNKFIQSGKISYGHNLLLENFTSSDIIISISKKQIGKDTMVFYIHNKKGPAMNYLDIAVGKGKFIKIK